MKTLSKESLNKKAKAFLLDHCVSVKNAEVMAFGFTGFINSNELKDVTLIRENGDWRIFNSLEQVLSINGTIDCFSLTRNTIL